MAQPDAPLAPRPTIAAPPDGPPHIDLTDAATGDLTGTDVAPAPLVDLTDPVAGSTEMPVADSPVRASGLLVLGKRRERLRDLIAREREEIEHTAPVVSLHRAADLAPFPLPEVHEPAVDAADVTDTPRRVPKAVRPDAAGRPLTDDVAAAIARLTGATDSSPTTTEATLDLTADAPFLDSIASDTATGEAFGRRFEIVPLDDPTPTAPVLHLPLPGVDHRDQADTPPCPACTTPGVLEVIDRVSGVVHYSCRHCFRMWNESLDRP